MDSLPFTLLAFIVALAVLISIHEFGHFWVARKLGVKVLRFSIGFGKPLWKKTGKIDGTEYVVAAIPLGGYVKMLDEREAPVDDAELDRAFNRQSLKVRSAIVFAGPLFNFLFAIFAYWLVFVIGDTGMKPIIGEVKANSPAAEAGLLPGDRITAIGGRQTATWENTVYALLASSIETDRVSMSVSDEQDYPRSLQLDLSKIDPENTDVSLLEQMGVTPFSPKLPAIIGEVVVGEAADKAGLKKGDKITAVDREAVESWTAWVDIIRKNPEQSLQVSFQREATILETTLIPKTVKLGEETIGRIGAAAEIPEGFIEKYQAKVTYGPLVAMKLSIEKTWDFSVLTLNVLGKILIGDASVNNLSGPITIAQTAGKTASVGFIYFVKFLAVVSISLGVLNLLPIPVLDGGHLFFFLLEAIKGSPLSEGFVEIGHRIGLALLLALMMLAFYVDISRFVGN